MARKEPQNLDAEINALGCAFLNKEALDKVCEELTSSMFYDEKNAKIFEVLSSLRNKENSSRHNYSNKRTRKKWKWFINSRRLFLFNRSNRFSCNSCKHKLLYKYNI